MFERGLAMKQICILPWTDNTGSASGSVVGLNEDGTVWRYSKKQQGWIPYPMVKAEDSGRKNEKPF